uniref:Splicing regulator RBM11 n=1 Tax=Vombatus ursinus TaxID=29139 RepID=A0A4X2JT76_VOMUR
GGAKAADRTVFVGNLETRVREEILYELFLQAGPLTKVTICKDKEGRPKPFGFVCFKHQESVSYAIALLNGIRLYGRPINVQYRFGNHPTAKYIGSSVYFSSTKGTGMTKTIVLNTLLRDAMPMIPRLPLVFAVVSGFNYHLFSSILVCTDAQRHHIS